jgi:fumarylacetoacetase
MKTWLQVSPDSDFSIYNLPFGIFKTADRSGRIGMALGDSIIDLKALADLGLLDGIPFDPTVLENKVLNSFIALGKPVTSAVRLRVQALFTEGNTELQNNAEAVAKVLVDMAGATLLKPVHIPNYTDFYSSIEHATNVGKMFRPNGDALLPNWLHLPVGYHGRASSIVLSGTPIRRPKGQTKADDQPSPVFGPSRLLDFELEMGFVVGKATAMGESITVAQAEDYIFGLLLFNDWSARDIQKWEYVPLGPFLGKNFGSTISPWIVTLEALEHFRATGPVQQPEVLPYLQSQGAKNYDIQLQVSIRPEKGEGKMVSNSNFKYMYWNMCQQLAHHTVNGCNVEVGDLYASGTISGHEPDSFGSMLELTWSGKNPVVMPDGTERRFIADNDTVTITGFGQKGDIRVGFGVCEGKILPAL